MGGGSFRPVAAATAAFIVLLLCTISEGQMTCTRSQSSYQRQAYTATRQISHRYSYGCGFWGRRCHGTRYSTQYYIAYRSVIVYSTVCCSGYVNPGCVAYCSQGCYNGGTCVSPQICVCTDGWTGTSCSMDVDECALDLDVCHDNATCGNTLGSYDCTCDTGLQGGGYNCEDVDECALDLDVCHDNATCGNTPGSYDCTCDSGFQGDGYNCTDIDECALDLDVCHDNATCGNNLGSYDCSCDSGFQGDGYNCCEACNAEVTDGTFGSYSWPDTPVGSISEISCELGSVLGYGNITAFATRRCLEGGQWEDHDFSQCADTFGIVEDMDITPSNYEEVVSTLSDGVETAAADPEGQNEENIATVGNILVETATLLVDNEQVVIDVDTVNETVQILDNLQEWNATVVAVASTNIVESIESIVSSYAVQENFTELVIEGDNLAFAVERVELQTLMESGRGFSLTMDINGTLDAANTGGGADNFTELPSDEAASVFLPPSLFTKVENRSETGVFFFLYQTAVLFPLGGEAWVVSPGGAVTMVGSPIIAATVAGQMEEFRGLPDPVSILLQLRKAQNITTVTCVSYDFDAAGGRGNWTSEGCETKVIDDGDGVLDDEDIANCSCNHLTNFAVLVDICSRTGGCEISSEAQLALDVISIIGVALSLFGTIGTIITLLAFKKLRQRDFTKFHVQLCIALFCMLLVFVIGIDQTGVYEGCVTVSVLIHYFTLVAVMWMGAEATLMYQKLVTVFVQITVRYMFVLSLVCWLVPIIPAVIPAVVDWQDVISFTDTGDINFCFIGNTAVFFAAFLAPILAVILFNFVIFFIVIFVLIRHTMNTSLRTKGEMMDMKTAIRIIISITGVMFLFGLTWIFGALTIAESEVSLTFQILFAIFNSFQGFFVFLFFCVFNKDAREAWTGFCCHYSPHFSPSNYTNVHRSKLTTPTSRNLTKTGTYSLPTSEVPAFKNEMVAELTTTWRKERAGQ